jgi:phospholipid/cholesterol/gamma-HCH transport system ATP-binding protein
VVKDLKKSFGGQVVLAGVGLTVARGETIAVLGRSGTGKSVLLRLLIGLQQPDAGTICIDNQDVASLDTDQLAAVRKRIGFLFQQAALYDSLTIEENVAFPLRRHTQLSDEDCKKKVRELLASVGMSEHLDKLPSEISGGMQKRVGLARALALDPDILLLDEPTAGLDPITSAEIGDLISKLRKERSVTSIVVTHDLHNAREIADRLIVLEDGKIAEEGNFDALRQSHNPFVERFFRDAA